MSLVYRAELMLAPFAGLGDKCCPIHGSSVARAHNLRQLQVGLTGQDLLPQPTFCLGLAEHYSSMRSM